jgi:hypothetical protein
MWWLWVSPFKEHVRPNNVLSDCILLLEDTYKLAHTTIDITQNHHTLWRTIIVKKPDMIILLSLTLILSNCFLFFHFLHSFNPFILLPRNFSCPVHYNTTLRRPYLLQLNWFFNAHFIHYKAHLNNCGINFSYRNQRQLLYLFALATLLLATYSIHLVLFTEMICSSYEIAAHSLHIFSSWSSIQVLLHWWPNNKSWRY